MKPASLGFGVCSTSQENWAGDFEQQGRLLMGAARRSPTLRFSLNLTSQRSDISLREFHRELIDGKFGLGERPNCAIRH